MPFTRIALREGKSAEYRRALSEGVHRALQRAFDVPVDDIFMTVTEHSADNFFYGRDYLGIARSDDLVMIQITANNTRTLEQKRELYRLIADHLAERPGVRREDVFISLVEVLKEDWSFGNGIAQYVS
ncbi:MULTISPECIES: tautomerase family protein [Burkholderia]|uniref:Tautomerase family protein n=2 Tax=Burkholderia humptydooensis TaxID=430531 RepID=A0A7U4PBE7_9BURK|nr:MULTISPECIES: tautomerase family protein [Burkholderia]AGK49784.1 tautomerase enzyme family protein [Burkholderia thailandensis MSMB121]ATF33340.1 tautomerase family protein [Burkholderia thailandensis]AJY38905.1 tautomerase enzyme family protein [Burkholderia sp. 2002721687]ALX46470.1 4-oxalocrotonate tautomerase [Burkholderia humptydooensis]EIP85903.1 tautomerase enzyme family protein [Burkholderia humptydooensis MSMB43]